MPARRTRSRIGTKPRKRRSNRRAARRGGGDARPFDAAKLFPRLARRGPAFGIGVLFAIAESSGGKPALRLVRRESFSKRPGGRNRSKLLDSVNESALARALAGLGQRRRVAVLRAILSGANTHAALRQATRLDAGPLYHHLRSLERAELVRFVERNRYDVTPFGRDLIALLTVACAGKARPSAV